MRTLTVLALLLTLTLPALANTVRCSTREDPAFKRWVTTCSDGARTITRYNRS